MTSTKDNFDPNGVGVANGNIFGFPVDEEEANIVILPIPWDTTASFGKGTCRGPEQILEVSTQLDFYHPKLSKAYNTKVFMSHISQQGLMINDEFEQKTTKYFEFIEHGGKLSEELAFQELIKEVNEVQNSIKQQVKDYAEKAIKSNKIPAVLGGEHSVPLGLLEAINDQEKSFGVLQLDAHADLRDAYEGFEQSHASIFFNALKLDKLEKLVQVGIRDVAECEIDLINQSKGRIKTFFDWDIKNELYKGKTWAQKVDEIVAELPQNVYVSFDIDVLDPSLCPNTGTPVSGGFKLEELTYLLFELVDSGRKIIGFDLCEVANGKSEKDWDSNVGARVLWELVVATELSRKD